MLKTAHIEACELLILYKNEYFKIFVYKTKIAICVAQYH